MLRGSLRQRDVRCVGRSTTWTAMVVGPWYIWLTPDGPRHGGIRSSEGHAESGGNMLRIVIAAADTGLGHLLATALAPAQVLEVVGTALDGESALDVVRRTQPDVVLLDGDMAMPSRDGLALVAAIKEAVPETLVVVLAAEVRGETAHAALAAGAMCVLAKDGSAQLPADLGWSDPGECRGTRPSRQDGTHREPSSGLAQAIEPCASTLRRAPQGTRDVRHGTSKQTLAASRASAPGRCAPDRGTVSRRPRPAPPRPANGRRAARPR